MVLIKKNLTWRLFIYRYLDTKNKVNAQFDASAYQPIQSIETANWILIKFSSRAIAI